MPFLTAKDVSVELNIPLARVYELTRRGQIPALRLGDKQLRYDPRVLREWARRAVKVDPTDSDLVQETEVHDG